jgi:hypothetical protein
MTESPMQDTQQEHYTGLHFVGLWLGMLGAGLFLMTALFHGVGALVASALALFS